MKEIVKMRRIMLAIVFPCVSCTQTQQVKERAYVEENKVPGTVTEPWVEPIYDTVQVPAGLDPTGTYFRPSHQTVVEIRPGRVQPVQYPDSQKPVESDQWKR